MSVQILEGELGLSKVEKLSSEVRRCIAGPDSIARPPGEYFVPIEPNSFGLPSVDTCPGKTDYCELDCYAIEAEKRTATHEKLQRNLDILESTETQEAMTDKIRGLVGRYVESSTRMEIPEDKRRFRIHWSGDFFSPMYAAAWRTVIEENPGIQFFTYTRSYQEHENAVPMLYGLENLDLFLSVDCENVDRAVEVTAAYPNVRVAYLVDYAEEADELIDKLGRRDNFRQFACPENMRDDKGKRKLPVISSKGGACSRCTYCIGKPLNWDVVFVKEGLVFRPQSELPFDVPVELITRPRKREKVAQPAGSLVLAGNTASLF